MVKKESNKVFVPMACDLIHEGHINILENASRHGDVVVGLLTDKAIGTYKPLPILSYEKRKKIILSLKFVKSVYKTTEWDYQSALEKLKPEVVVHGDDWKSNNQKQVRANVINQIKKWKGKLVEIPYTKGISSSDIKKILKESLSPFLRTQTLSRIMEAKKMIRVIEVHNGITAHIAENSKYKNKSFDCMWLSSLTHSTSKGKPDIEYIDDTTVLNTINDIFDCTSKPLIFDGDSGGLIEHLKYTVSNLGRVGVSAIIFEDKVGNKKNSLVKTSHFQEQDSIENFCKKIETAKRNSHSSGMKIFARIESFILNKGLEDSIIRAKEYIKAGVDGIMIHSKKKNPSEIFSFSNEYNKFSDRKPLIVVPSTYEQVNERKLREHEVNIVIYANQLLRSAIPAMKKTAEEILKNERSYESKKNMMSISEILALLNNK